MDTKYGEGLIAFAAGLTCIRVTSDENFVQT